MSELANRILTVLKANAIEVPGGMRGQPVDFPLLASACGDDLRASAEQVRDAIMQLAESGALAILPPKKGDTHDLWVRLPLTAAERQRRSRALRRRQGLKAVTIYLPEGASPEETERREAELRAYVEARWGKQPDLF